VPSGADVAFSFSSAIITFMKKPAIKALLFASFLTAALLQFTAAESRDLYWDSIIVKATLDENGSLHVSEVQDMVFDGYWNGGERWFDLNPGEGFAFHRISRLNETTGAFVEMNKGGLDNINDYKWVDSQKIRWRSRLPTDPPFKETSIIYKLEFTYSNILKRSGNEYILNHEFLFSDRTGIVVSYYLELDLDPEWKVLSGGENRIVYRSRNIPPGESHSLKLNLGFTGTTDPSTNKSLPPLFRFGGLVIAGIIIIYHMHLFYKRDKQLGRFKKIPSFKNQGIDFLKENLLKLLPEVAGALWDEEIGTAEVTAVFARWERDKIISSDFVQSESFFGKLFGKKEIRLTRHVEAKSLKGYEKSLFSKLFFNNRKTVTPSELKEYYKKKVSGFYPVQIIQPQLASSMNKKFPKFKDKGLSSKEWAITWQSFLVWLAFAILSFVIYGFTGAWPILVYSLLIIIAFVITIIISAVSKSYAALGRPILVMSGLTFVILPIFAAYLVCDLLFQISIMPVSFLAIVFLILSFSFININTFKITNTKEKIALRRNLIAIRNYFKQELKKPYPNLKDEWHPYLLALGLADQMDSWFTVHGAARSTRTYMPSSSRSLSGKGSSWTGMGGGRSGGAGASRSWASAISSISGMSPSSSGGGGGGGGGGGSGGGGGGGW